MVKQKREPMLKMTIHDAAGQRRLELAGSGLQLGSEPRSRAWYVDIRFPGEDAECYHQ
jgi:hypothetical protein